MKARPFLAAAALVLAGSLAAPPALADTTISGRTSQSRPVSIVLRDDGSVRLVRISWATRLCRRRGNRIRGRTDFRPPYDVNDPGHVEGSRIHNVRRSGLRVRANANFVARQQAPGQWRGTVSGGMEVFRGGRKVNDCALRLITWTAAP